MLSKGILALMTLLTPSKSNVILRAAKAADFYLFIFADSGVAETVTYHAMRPFQRLALNKNEVAKNSASVTARSIDLAKVSRGLHMQFSACFFVQHVSAEVIMRSLQLNNYLNV